MITRLVDAMAGLPPGLLLTLVFLLPGVEASTLIGVVVPGETAVLLGGVVAEQGRLSLTAVIVAAVAGAIIGDQVGYVVGRRWGDALLARVPRILLKPEMAARALDVVRRRGVLAVLLGRWTASLRALVPGVAGMAGMSRRTFTAANVVGGATWASVVAVAGYLAGSSYRRVESEFGRAGEIGSLVVIAVIVVVVAVRHFQK